jgi:hypothetical protein
MAWDGHCHGSIQLPPLWTSIIHVTEGVEKCPLPSYRCTFPYAKTQALNVESAKKTNWKEIKKEEKSPRQLQLEAHQQNTRVDISFSQHTSSSGRCSAEQRRLEPLVPRSSFILAEARRHSCFLLVASNNTCTLIGSCYLQVSNWERARKKVCVSPFSVLLWRSA